MKNLFCGFKSRNELDKITFNALKSIGYNVDLYFLKVKKNEGKSLFIYHSETIGFILANLLLPVFIFKFLWILIKYDTYFFFAGYSLIPIPLQLSKFERFRYIDLIFLNFFKKKVVYTFQGSELRSYNIMLNGSLDKLKNIDYWSEKNIFIRKISLERVFKYSDILFVTTPDLLNDIPEKYSHKSHLLLKPSPSISNNTRMAFPLNKEVIRIIHAPTNRFIKGTSHIIEAVKYLNKKKHLNIELILVEGKSRRELYEMAKTCNFAIDQLNIGWYGSFSVEMLQLGIPVMCYLKEIAVDKTNINRNDIPIIQVTKDTLADDIIKFLEKSNDVKFIIDYRNKVASYLHNNHSHESFINRMSMQINALEPK